MPKAIAAPKLTGLNSAADELRPVHKANFFNLRTNVELNRSALKLLQRGRPNAFFMPAVNFILGLTCGIFSRLEIEEQMPREVALRGMRMLGVAKALVGDHQRDRTFLNAYESSPILRKGLSPYSRRVLTSGEYLGNLCMSPFAEVYTIGGGGYAALLNHRVIGDKVGIIADSSELPKVSAISATSISEMLQRVYNDHYLPPKKFSVDKSPDVATIGYSQSFRHEMVEYMSFGHGCPAVQAREADMDMNYTRTYWRDLTHLVLGSAPVVTYGISEYR